MTSWANELGFSFPVLGYESVAKVSSASFVKKDFENAWPLLPNNRTNVINLYIAINKH